MKNDKDSIDTSAVEDHGGILTIRGGGARRDWNGIHYKQGMSGKNVGTTSLSANIATIPPGGVKQRFRFRANALSYARDVNVAR